MEILKDSIHHHVSSLYLIPWLKVSYLQKAEQTDQKFKQLPCRELMVDGSIRKIMESRIKY